MFVNSHEPTGSRNPPNSASSHPANPSACLRSCSSVNPTDSHPPSPPPFTVLPAGVSPSSRSRSRSLSTPDDEDADADADADPALAVDAEAVALDDDGADESLRDGGGGETRHRRRPEARRWRVSDAWESETVRWLIAALLLLFEGEESEGEAADIGAEV